MLKIVNLDSHGPHMPLLADITLIRISIRLTLKHKSRPIKTGSPSSLAQHSKLRSSQRGGGTLSLSEHLFIELFHQRGSSVVIYFPKTGDDARGACVHEAARQAHQAFASDLLAQCGLTRTQHDEVGTQL